MQIVDLSLNSLDHASIQLVLSFFLVLNPEYYLLVETLIFVWLEDYQMHTQNLFVSIFVGYFLDQIFLDLFYLNTTVRLRF